MSNNSSKENKAKWARNWRKKNPERRKIHSQKYYSKNSEKCIARVKKYYLKNRDKILKQRKDTGSHRNTMLKSKYGITLEDYNKMLLAQNSLCAICGKRDTRNKSMPNLAVDHCHQTGKVRGLLCDRCNFSLGGFEDNINLLNKAIEYLKIH